jgi:plastocyanin
VEQQMPSQRRDGLSFVAAGMGALALVFSIVAIAIASANHGPDAGPAISTRPVVVAVTVKEFSFSPNAISTSAGPVTFRIKNTGAITHNLSVEGVGKSPDVAPGQSVTWDAGVLAAGTYKVECPISGHVGAGMTATLTVVAA